MMESVHVIIVIIQLVGTGRQLVGLLINAHLEFNWKVVHASVLIRGEELAVFAKYLNAVLDHGTLASSSTCCNTYRLAPKKCDP